MQRLKTHALILEAASDSILSRPSLFKQKNNASKEEWLFFFFA